jgi:spore germination protein YaaH
VLVALAGIGGCALATATLVTPSNARPFFVAGYHPYWAGRHWDGYPRDLLDELYFFELEAASDGSFLDRHGWPGQWTALIADAAEADVQLTPTVSMHDPEAFQALFRDPDSVERLVSGIESLLAETPGLAGIHLDFEVFQPVDLTVRDGFTSFVARLRGRLRTVDPSLSLSIFTLAFDDDDVYDERSLAELADYLVVQGYDYHHMASDSAGPVGPVVGWGRLNWSFVVDRFEALGVPPGRLVMTVPMYGYEWPVASDEVGARTAGAGVAVPLTAPEGVRPELPRAADRISRHGARRDERSGVPYWVFRDGAQWYQGWAEDARSLSLKYDFVRERGLGGVAIFPIAYADAEHWDALRRALESTTP